MVKKDQTQRIYKSFTWRLDCQQDLELDISSATPLSQDGFSVQKVCSYESSSFPSFPNQLPYINWKANLPKFKEEKEDDVAIQLINFHIHIHRLRVDFPKDCLMKMFMATLEERTRLWYERLSPTSIYALEDFYSAFCENYKEIYPSIELVENFCGNF